ncbi:hypothetical protein Ccrd_017838, partial [Cynara cardunculus var. scolymus]
MPSISVAVNKENEMIPSSELVAVEEDYYSSGAYSSGENDDKKPDTGNIEEAESSLRENGSLNYEETLNRAVELLPELWKLAGSPQEAVLSFRRALLHHQNLNAETTAKIQKEFVVFLLYNGGEEAVPPNLRSQMDSSFVPRNNIEEAILLLMILLRKVSLKMIEWDPMVLDHLSYATAISGGLGALCTQLEELPPGVIDEKE